MSSSDSSSSSSWVNVEVPSTCKLNHKAIRLPNGAKIVVVQDPDTTSSAAAMSIRVGSNQDPPELPGLAHLCEHMLFLGTEKYPKEGEYDGFISQHGGGDNAWTEDGCTNYYFTISSAQILEALDRFLHFFVCPLFTADSLEREVLAVHSEDEKNHNIDFWRKEELFKLNIFDKKHPQAYYGNGNKKTLWTDPREKGIDVRARILEFYHKYYVADAACLCVHSPLPPEEILAAAQPILMKMQTGPRADNTFNNLMPFNSECFQNWYNLKAVKGMQKIRMEWMVPFSVNSYDTSPSHYVSHVIGHEVKGSLFAYLQELGYAESLVAGCSGRGVDDDWDSFCIDIDLTTKGMQNMNQVLKIVFQAIRVLKDAGVQDDILVEDMAAKKLSFNLTDVGRPHNHACALARSGNFFPLERIYSGQVMYYKTDKEAIKRCIDMLRPETAVFLFRSNKLVTAAAAADGEEKEQADLPEGTPKICYTPLDQETEHHKAPFCVSKIDPTLIQEWSNILTTPNVELPPQLHMPAPNKFLAEDLTVYPFDKEKAPKKYRTKYGTFFWRRDTGLHEKPRSAFAVELQSPIAYLTSQNRFLFRVFHSMLKDALTEIRYYAELAFIRTQIVPMTDGIDISADGPSEKLPDMFKLLLDMVFNLKVTPELYTKHTEKVTRDLESSKMDQPYRTGLEASNVWTFKHRWGLSDVHAASATLKDNFDAFSSFLTDYRSKLYYEAFWFGNIPPNDASTDGNKSNSEDGASGTQTCSFINQIVSVLEGTLEANKVAIITDYEKEIPEHRTVLQLPKPSSQEKDGAAAAKGWLLAQPTINKAEPNSSVMVCYQLGVKYPKQRALVDCLDAMIRSKFFAVLRTSETLGYIVTVGARVIEDTVQLAFIVQSAAFDATYCFSRIWAFISVFKDAILKKFTEEEWKSVVTSQISAREDKPKTISGEGGKLWGRRRNPFGFFIEDLEVEELKNTIKQQDVTDLVTEAIENGVPYVTLYYNEKPAALEGLSGRPGEVAKMPLFARKTALTGKEPLQLPGFGASMEVPEKKEEEKQEGGEEEAKDEKGEQSTAAAAAPSLPDPTEFVYLQCVPNNFASEGPASTEFREEFRASLTPFVVDESRVVVTERK